MISLSLLLAFSIVFYGLKDDIQTSDAAVILGSKVEMNGQPSARLTARLDRGLALYKSGVTHILIVSGGTGIEGFNEATVMRSYLHQKGIPLSSIIVDEQGNNTEATAKHCAEIMKSHNFKSVILITQYFHVARTHLALKGQNIETIHSAHAYYFELRDVYSLTLRGGKNRFSSD